MLDLQIWCNNKDLLSIQTELIVFCLEVCGDDSEHFFLFLPSFFEVVESTVDLAPNQLQYPCKTTTGSNPYSLSKPSSTLLSTPTDVNDIFQNQHLEATLDVIPLFVDLPFTP
ncbi:hypothetical protein J6590_019599 [Homalodisca vitripennis]|nr:hypothetical protein J6590_019599 [Homalodisca vitripennis]